MFGPKRKIGENTFEHIDPPITQQKNDEFTRILHRLKRVERPIASKEVMIMTEGGDFSEYAGYQASKRRLRNINSKITLWKINQYEILQSLHT